MREKNRIFKGDVVIDNHGSDYEKYTLLISKAVTIKDLLSIADDIATIQDPAQLTESDLDEFRDQIRKSMENRTCKLSDIQMFSPPVRGLPEPKAEAQGQQHKDGIVYRDREETAAPQPPKQRRKREKNPNEHTVSSISSQVYQYQTPIIETETVLGETVTRDYELERTIQNNGLLPFNKKWYSYPPSSRLRGGWTIETAIVEAVEYQHRYTWADLQKKYNIPQDYVDEWKKLAKRIRENK